MLHTRGVDDDHGGVEVDSVPVAGGAPVGDEAWAALGSTFDASLHEEVPPGTRNAEADRIEERDHGMDVDVHRSVRGIGGHKHLHGHKLLHSLQTLQYCSNHKPTVEVAYTHLVPEVVRNAKEGRAPCPVNSDFGRGEEAFGGSVPPHVLGSSYLVDNEDVRSSLA